MANPENSADKQLSFVGKFIDKYYLHQNPWIQSLTFLIFVLLFAYGFMTLLAGKIVLQGNLLALTKGPHTFLYSPVQRAVGST